MPKPDTEQKEVLEPSPEVAREAGPPGLGEETALSRDGCFHVSRTALIYRYLLLSALTLIGVLILALLFPMAVADRDYLVGTLLAVWALALLRYWFFLLSMPYRICPEGGDALVFHSPFRRRKVLLGEIAALRVSPFYQSYLRIVTSGKKSIPMLNHVDGLHELIARIKRVNPDLKTRGC